MLRWRLLLGTLLIAAVVALGWLDDRSRLPGIALFPLLAIFTWLATGEMLRLLQAAGTRPIGWVAYVGNLALISVAWATSLSHYVLTQASAKGESAGNGDSAAVSLLLTLAGSLLVAFLAEMRRYEGPGGTIANLGAAVLAMAYVGLLSSFMILLRMRWGIAALATLVVVVKFSDIGAYTVGRLVGRTKLAPRLSPGKTVEGGLGALVFGCFGAWLVFTGFGFPSHQWWRWIVFGLIAATGGMVGDLTESLLKRDAGRKDSSQWMPGFGGVLDIFDSLLVAAPVVYACWLGGLVGR